MLISFTGIKKKYNMDIKGVIHIGGHFGEEVQEYADNGIRDIILFEPLVENFNVLREHVQNIDADIRAYQVALGSKSGRAIMYVSSNNRESSSILKPKVHLQHHPDIHFNSTEQVHVRVLDEFDTGGANFINIDVNIYYI